MTDYRDYLASHGYVRRIVERTTKRPGDVVLSSPYRVERVVGRG